MKTVRKTDSTRGAHTGHPVFVVPPVPEERLRWRRLVREYAARESLVPPLSREDLGARAMAFASEFGVDPVYCDWLTVVLNNEAWRETLAAVPYERRVLLLPKCLRSKDTCPAKLDEVGLVCEECGSCCIGSLQSTAENLGYVVLVAEGTTVVTKLIQADKVDAVVGVSCMSVLDRAFPHMVDGAVPGIAIPLATDGCVDTSVDIEWVMEAIHTMSASRWEGRLDVDSIRDEVRSWFDAESLRRVISADGSETGEIAVSFLARGGKRWRPILAACVYRALDGVDETWPDALRSVAFSVECFHKASLIHDDIEDGDTVRDNFPTMHAERGVPVSLNVGDFLIGEGYRLLASAAVPPAQVARMLAAAADAQRTLCLGQGEELCWMKNPSPLSPSRVLEIFRMKTEPAFEVALSLGALAQGAGDQTCSVLARYSRALGVAYQIRDDLLDFDSDLSAAGAAKPSLLAALVWESADPSLRARIDAAWRSGPGTVGAIVREAAAGSDVEARARELLEHYRCEAIRSLGSLRNVRLKSVLQQIIVRILR